MAVLRYRLVMFMKQFVRLCSQLTTTIAKQAVLATSYRYNYLRHHLESGCGAQVQIREEVLPT